MNEKLERLDIVDESDNVTGEATKSDIYSKNLKYYRIVKGIIRTSEGKILLPKRSKYKYIFPNCYDISLSGHVDKGESYEEALKREMKEELDIEGASYKEIGYLTPQQLNSNYFIKLFMVNYDGKIRVDENEVESANYVELEQLYKLIEKEPESFKDDFLFLLKIIRDSKQLEKIGEEERN